MSSSKLNNRKRPLDVEETSEGRKSRKFEKPLHDLMVVDGTLHNKSWIYIIPSKFFDESASSFKFPKNESTTIDKLINDDFNIESVASVVIPCTKVHKHALMTVLDAKKLVNSLHNSIKTDTEKKDVVQGIKSRPKLDLSQVKINKRAQESDIESSEAEISEHSSSGKSGTKKSFQKSSRKSSKLSEKPKKIASTANFKNESALFSVNAAHNSQFEFSTSDNQMRSYQHLLEIGLRKLEGKMKAYIDLKTEKQTHEITSVILSKKTERPIPTVDTSDLVPIRNADELEILSQKLNNTKEMKQMVNKYVGFLNKQEFANVDGFVKYFARRLMIEEMRLLYNKSGKTASNAKSNAKDKLPASIQILIQGVIENCNHSRNTPKIATQRFWFFWCKSKDTKADIQLLTHLETIKVEESESESMDEMKDVGDEKSNSENDEFQ